VVYMVTHKHRLRDCHGTLTFGSIRLLDSESRLCSTLMPYRLVSFCNVVSDQLANDAIGESVITNLNRQVCEGVVLPKTLEIFEDYAFRHGVIWNPYAV